MELSKMPTKPGIFWATLDNGNGKLEVVLLRVGYYSGETSFDTGAVCVIVDCEQGDYPWQFVVDDFNQEIVQPWRTAYAASRGAQSREQVKITWHGEAEPPIAALKQQPVTTAANPLNQA